MASSAQSGGSSGGPAVPTVQRGIVKMVRAGTGTPIPLATTVRESGAGSFPCRQPAWSPRSSFLCPFPHFSPVLGIPYLDANRHGLPWVPCLPDTLALGVTVISVIAALSLLAVYQDRQIRDWLTGIICW